ncbi:MAG: acyl-CoA dehydrogenase family protein [Candidatus Aminicenantes bacterium]|nr:acyl-CoA dehydrogenase family protein [Candidatus Aminicenantes bacterium]
MTDERAESIAACRDMVRDFARTEIAPHVREWDEKAGCPPEVFRKLGELGLLGVFIPEEYGGVGLSYRHYAMILEELGAVEGGIALSVAAHNSLCTNHVYMFGTEEVRRKWLPQLAGGKILGAWALTEPEAGSDSGATKTTAVRNDRGWVLNGTKNFITHASVGEVGVIVARTKPGTDHHGISAFLVPLKTQGVTVGKHEDKVGMRVSDTASLVLEDCQLGPEALLGKEGDGFIQAMEILDGGRISIAALSVGIARGALDAAVAYAKQRRQFGRPIAAFQAVRFKLADMATQVNAARLLTERAADLKDSGGKTTSLSAQAKYYASEVAVHVGEEAVQILGGYGYCKDYPVEKFWRDAKLCTIGEGTSEIQKLVIARELIGE